MNKLELITTRDFLPDDINLIYATWLRGLYYGESIFSLMQKSTFMECYHRYLTSLLNSPNVKIKVACLREEPSVVLAYLVMNKEETAVHWMFTKKDWRKIGLMKDLLPKTVSNITHLTKVGQTLMQKYNWKYNPFIL
jgi:hypothetical protein